MSSYRKVTFAISSPDEFLVLYSIVSGRFIHGGQILNGLAGPVTMAAPPLISATWFPASQRTTATSLGILSGNIGFSLSFVIGNVSKLLCV